jgi:hypothetical protein
MPRAELGPDDRLMRITDAAAALGVSVAAVRARCERRDPTIRGLRPRSEHNPGPHWLVCADDVDAVRRGNAPPPAAPTPETGTLEDLRVEMLAGALSEEKDRRIAHLEDERARTQSLYERQLADRDARVAQLERQLAVQARSLTLQARQVEEMLTVPGLPPMEP